MFYYLLWSLMFQGHMVTTGPTYMFANLRHLTCEIKIFTHGLNKHSGLLQLAHNLSFAPQLETLQLHVNTPTVLLLLVDLAKSSLLDHAVLTGCVICADAVRDVSRLQLGRGGDGEEAASCLRRLDRLKTVYMSGFRCYRPQVELLCGILATSPALEHVTLQPKVTLACARVLNMCILEFEIWRWARSASERFGKAITVVRRTSP